MKLKWINIVGFLFILSSCTDNREVPISIYSNTIDSKFQVDKPSIAGPVEMREVASPKKIQSVMTENLNSQESTTITTFYNAPKVIVDDYKAEIDHPIVKAIFEELEEIEFAQTDTLSDKLDFILQKESFENIYEMSKEFCSDNEWLEEQSIDSSLCSQYLDGGYEPQAWIAAKVYSLELSKILAGSGVSQPEIFVFPKSNWFFKRDELSFYFQEDNYSLEEFKSILLEML